MKNIIAVLVLPIIVFILSTCTKARKNVMDYYPEVSTVSANVTEDGGVEVTANVTLKTGALNYAGFCMDTLPSPDMMKNQVLVDNLNAAEFKSVYAMNFDAKKTYYFRSWAASDKGYAYGNTISLTNIKATPLSPPCMLNINSSNIGTMGSSGSGPEGSAYQVTAVDNFSSTWDITSYGYTSSAGTLYFHFGSEPKTKVFTTTEGSAYGDMVFISVSSGFSSGYVLKGYKVYVNKISEGVFEITVCDAPWKLDGGSSATFKLNARFISPH
ncbi:MAG: hypothetical protein JNL60_04300 [Bacteroidia bacterium]|nr:hypothetical protein [Bacteroidia bacterium]